jgi:dienelactone hydrolase
MPGAQPGPHGNGGRAAPGGCAGECGMAGGTAGGATGWGGVAGLVGWRQHVLAAGRVAPDVPSGLLRGLIAFYPGCRGAAAKPGWKPVVPLLILMGESDDWTPAAPCHVLAGRTGSAVTLVTYPGAYHDFDAPVPVRERAGIPSSQRGDGGVHVGGDPDARADAMRRVPAFVGQLPPTH